jgi:hypothetical protein
LRREDFAVVLFFLAALSMTACSNRTTGTTATGTDSDSSVTGAMPTGVTASAIVELSDMYRSPEIYDAKITVLEILRGEEAADLIDNAGDSNAPARSGFEYLLAHIRFEFFARGAPGDKTWNLSAKQFHAFSRNGTRYATPSIVPPEPELAGELRPGDSQQGWIVFEVTKQDRKPLMIFDQGNVWFQLY